MTSKNFRFESEGPKIAFDIDISNLNDVATLKQVVGSQFGVVEPEGLSFYANGQPCTDWDQLKSYDSTITVKVNGHAVRPVPGPTGLPFIGNYFEVYPDHLGNLQRLFEKHGPVVKTNIMGNETIFTNDPAIAQISLAETESFSKEIRAGHPLFPIKNNKAGVFLGDTSDPSWKIVHKFLPPALGPKAVRHYAPIMNNCIDEAFPIFDELEDKGVAWNAYQYMLKLSSGTVAKIMLGKDVGHFKTADAPLDRLILAVAEQLAINKKISSKGSWYSYMPFGDPARLRELQKVIHDEVIKYVSTAEFGGEEDLPLQDAALKSHNIIDYLSRAVDSTGNKLPKENIIAATLVATGAGFTTTSSLLAWCLHAFTAYEGVQASLLQELVDNDINDGTNITADQIDELPVLDKFVKEVQRRHNPAYQPARTALKDTILPGGYLVKKDAVVIAAIHNIHNNPAVWSNPDRFDPDRWDTEEVKQRHKAAYIPFATGGRMCVGFNFALLEVKIFVCKLIWRYHWDKEGEADTEYDAFFQLIRPVNLYVRTQKREVYPTKSDS